MVATRGRTFKRPWRRSCLSSKLKSSSAPIGRKDSWCFHAVGSSNAPLLGSTAAEGLPQSASCSENFVIPPDVFGQTLSETVVVHGNVPHDRPRSLVSHLIGNRASFLCTKAPMLRVPDKLSRWHSQDLLGGPSLAAHRINGERCRSDCFCGP